MSDKAFRIEHDSMGELQVPEDALWGAQTQRAVNNFPISGLTMPRQFIAALGLVKWAAAVIRKRLGHGIRVRWKKQSKIWWRLVPNSLLA